MAGKEAKDRCPEKSVGERVKTWTHIIAIIVGAGWASVWGISTFYYKEVWVPQSAPVNITLDLSLQKSGTNINRVDRNNKPLSAIEFKVAAKNPSTRSIYLLPSVFFVYGYKIENREINNGPFDATMSSKSRWFIEKHTKASGKIIIALGNLLSYDALFPNEIEAKTFVFHVPKGEYDILEIYARILTVAKDKSGITLEWKLAPEINEPRYRIFYEPTHNWFSRLLRKGSEKQELIIDKDTGFSESDKNLLEKLEFQEARSSSMISLWGESKIDSPKAIKTTAD